jgi:CheY-like chemotaxis protein
MFAASYYLHLRSVIKAGLVYNQAGMTLAKPLIISIDDETNILKLVKLVLEPLCTVLTFTDTKAALKTLQTSRPDLIICDINMPGLDGFELHTLLRDSDTLRSVPFVYLTALADRETFRKGMLQGADDYLIKPFSPEERGLSAPNCYATRRHLNPGAFPAWAVQPFLPGAVRVIFMKIKKGSSCFYT